MSEELAKLYCSSLDEVRMRLTLIRSVCNGSLSAGSEIFNYEIASVNLRKCLELIAFGSLTANKDVYASMHAKFEEHWRAKRILENLEKIHPDFYPIALLTPVISSETPRNVHFELETQGFLTRNEFVELYDLCSKVIHSRNPFEVQTTINFRLSVSEWTNKIETLLRFHRFQLAGVPYIWVGELYGLNDGKAHVYIASPI